MMDQKDKKTEINYLFFSFVLLFVLALTFAHFFRMGTPLWGAPLFFLLYALGQALLEVFCVMLIGYALHRWLPRWIFHVYIGLCFGFLVAHFTNYTLVRLMDVTITYFFKFFFGCGFEHFLVTFAALNLSVTMTAIIIAAILLVPLVGIGFYSLTHKVSLKKPLMLKQRHIFSMVIILSLALFSLDIIAKPFLNNALYDKYSKTLPLGSTFLAPHPGRLALPSCIKHARNETELQQLLSNDSFSCAKHPNIYLFIIETLRRDFVNFEVAPNMSLFAKQNIAPTLSYSNANSTHLSWFAIFHSAYPYQWTEVRDTWAQGSIPLQIFKKLGYKIRAYSAADLSYFNMDQIIFGRNLQLADSIQDFSHLHHLEPCDRDQLAIEALLHDTSDEKEGTLFIVFLDSTHSEYSSPKDFSHPFQPSAVFVDYLSISQSSNDLELLKNRYRNSIHWVDHLMGHFLESIKNNGLYDEALIVMTGDHGEEFFEEGALFHGTHLNEYQTRIPLFLKFPKSFPATLTTHIDIFPTMLHFLTGKSFGNEYFDGKDLWAKNRSSFALSVQHNGPDVPYEFLLNDGQNKLLARFLNPPFIHSIPSIEMLSYQTKKGREEPKAEEIEKRFSAALEPLFDRAPK